MTALLARWTEKLAGGPQAGTSDSPPPLARVMGVGRQQHLQSESGRKNCFRIAKQMAREGGDVISVCCMKNDAGNVVSDADGMRNIWRKYI